MRAIQKPALWLSLSIVGLASVVLFFREFFLSQFDAIAGTRDDCLFIIAILEHWYHVFLGTVADFRSPNFFAPVTGALGFSDALFLFALPYAAIRAIGYDPFLSFELTLI